MNKELTLEVKRDHKHLRLDKFLTSQCPEYSRTLVQRFIKDGLVLVNKKQVKSGFKLKENDKVSVRLPKLEEPRAKPEQISLDVIFEDKDLIVVNKQQGMVTHPSSGCYSGTLVNALLSHCKDSLSGVNGVLRPGIVHRLDKDTSGLIIACKNDKAHNEIARQLKERKINKYYYAIVRGQIKYDQGTISKPIGRDRVHRHKMSIVQRGKESTTRWKVLKKFKDYTFLEVKPETGRTHQIRVHLASIGHPIVGDKTYGTKNDSSKLMLHAYKLEFFHPQTKKIVKLEIEMPGRFKKFLD